MISIIKKKLNTEIVIDESLSQSIKNIVRSVLINNIFIFFVLGTILSIKLSNLMNGNNYNDDWFKEFWTIDIKFLSFNFIPFIIAIILKSIIKLSKNKKIKKIFKIIMIITNILSMIYIIFLALLYFSIGNMQNDDLYSNIFDFYCLSLRGV